MKTKFRNDLDIVLSEPQLTENSDCSNCQRLLDSIKEKLTDCSNEIKIQLLTPSLEDWTIKKSGVFQCQGACSKAS